MSQTEATIYGPVNRFEHGDKCSLADTLFNVRSGRIKLGNNVTFAHRVMVLTGYHDYKGDMSTVEDAGRDVYIGDNVLDMCWCYYNRSCYYWGQCCY